MEEVIKDLIKDHEARATKMRDMYHRYRAEKLPIDSRTFEDETKINNHISNDYRGEIVEGVTGYLFGQPISYQIDQKELGKEEGARLNKILDRWETMNNLPDLDNQTGKIAAICGYGARLLFVDSEGMERVTNINPWETIFVEEASTGDVELAIRHYQLEDGDELVTKVEVYDNENVTYYIESEGEYILDLSEEKNPQSHMFSYVPLIKFANNDEEMGDFEKVEPLIDAYDRLVSDAQNELEEFRQAYMKFLGAEITPEIMKEARQSGGFGMPEGTDVGFITKDINDVFLENQKKTLNDNIYKFSQTVDMADESFSGAGQSGESRKWKLLALENKAISKERKFSRGLREQFKVLMSAWSKKGTQVDYLDVSFTFKRNTPIDMLYEAEIIQKLKGLISDETLFKNSKIVDDAYNEIERIEDEQSLYVSIDEGEEYEQEETPAE